VKITNLLQETENILKEYGKTWKDIRWIGSEDWGWFDWFDFVVVAQNDYCDRDVQVASDLVVVGDDWWLERWEDESGLSGWAFKTLPKRPKMRVVPTRVMMWKNEPYYLWDLKPMNDEDYIKNEIQQLKEKDGYFETERKTAIEVYTNKEVENE